MEFMNMCMEKTFMGFKPFFSVDGIRFFEGNCYFNIRSVYCVEVSITRLICWEQKALILRPKHFLIYISAINFVAYCFSSALSENKYFCPTCVMITQGRRQNTLHVSYIV